LGHSHNDHDHHHHHVSGKEGEKVFRLGLAADIGLAIGKTLTGYLSGSTAIIADAAHSISDVVTLLAVLELANVVCSVELLALLLFCLEKRERNEKKIFV
jgi:Co/Zn/Cd efflux system component